MSNSRGLPSSLTEYVLMWRDDLFQDLPTPARTDLAPTLSTMYEGGPWPTRPRIQRLAEQICGNYGDANTFVGDLHSERPGYVATLSQNLREPDQQTRDEALELLARLPGSSELVRAVEQGRLSLVERENVLRRALSNPVLPAPVPAPEAYPELPRDYPESYEDQERRDPPYELFRPTPDQTRDLAELDKEWKAGLLEVQA